VEEYHDPERAPLVVRCLEILQQLNEQIQALVAEASIRMSDTTWHVPPTDDRFVSNFANHRCSKNISLGREHLEQIAQPKRGCDIPSNNESSVQSLFSVFFVPLRGILRVRVHIDFQINISTLFIAQWFSTGGAWIPKGPQTDF